MKINKIETGYQPRQKKDNINTLMIISEIM